MAALLTILAGTLLLATGAEAQTPKKPARVAILSPVASPDDANPLNGAPLRAGLRDLGYVEGTTIQFEMRSADGDDARLPELARQLVDEKPDVIVAITVPAIRAVQRATRTIPIVMTLSSDPVRLGLVQSLPHPGGNTTGLAPLTFDLAPKRLELLREAVPGLRQPAILVNSTNPAVLEGATQTVTAAQSLGLRARTFEVHAATDFDAVFAAIVHEHSDGLIVVPDPLTALHARRIVEFAVRQRLPAMYGLRQMVDAGGLMAYGIDVTDHFYRAARYVDHILKGAKPADLPVETPTRFELVINLKTAKAQGLAMPVAIRLRADRIIE